MKEKRVNSLSQAIVETEERKQWKFSLVRPLKGRTKEKGERSSNPTQGLVDLFLLPVRGSLIGGVEEAVTELAAIEPLSVGGRHYLLVGTGSSYLISSGQWEED